jgi:hypothetical protein
MIKQTWTFLFVLVAVKSEGMIERENDSQKILKFWQISDIHLDQLYNVYGDPTEYCHNHLNNNSSNVNNNNNNSLGKFGDFRCEANLDLLYSAFEFMKSENENPG